MLLVGGDSAPFRRTVAETIAAAVPNSQIGVLPCQRHGAIEAAPDLFAQEVMTFLHARCVAATGEDYGRMIAAVYARKSTDQNTEHKKVIS